MKVIPIHIAVVAIILVVGITFGYVLYEGYQYEMYRAELVAKWRKDDAIRAASLAEMAERRHQYYIQEAIDQARLYKAAEEAQALKKKLEIDQERLRLEAVVAKTRVLLMQQNADLMARLHAIETKLECQPK